MQGSMQGGIGRLEYGIIFDQGEPEYESFEFQKDRWQFSSVHHFLK